MDHVVLGINVDDQPTDDPYVLAFRRTLKKASSTSFSPLPVLLAYRVWYIDQNITRSLRHHKSQLRPVLHVIIDAGMIYSFTLLAALICFVNRSNGQYVILDLVGHSSTIASSLMRIIPVKRSY